MQLLQGNGIVDVDSLNLQDLPSLKNLNVSNNNITDISSLKDLNLETLITNYNPIV